MATGALELEKLVVPVTANAGKYYKEMYKVLNTYKLTVARLNKIGATVETQITAPLVRMAKKGAQSFRVLERSSVRSMKGISAASGKSLGQVQAQLARVTRQASRTREEMRRLQIAVSRVRPARAFGPTPRGGVRPGSPGMPGTPGPGGGGGAAERLGSVGLGLSAGASLPIALTTSRVIDAISQYDSLERSLTTIMGSAEAARKEITQLREVARLPGLGFPEAIQGSTRLQAVGFSADQARKILLEFGNAIAATGGGRVELEAVIIQLQQMRSAGKVLMADFRPVMQRVPLMAKAVQAAFGTMDLQKIQQSGISVEKFISGVTGELSKLNRVSGGVRNSLENMGDAMFIAMASLRTAAAPMVESFAWFVENALAPMITGFGRLPVPIQQTAFAMTAALAAAGPLAFSMSGLVYVCGSATTAVKGLSVAWSALTLKNAERVIVAALTQMLIFKATVYETAAALWAGTTAATAFWAAVTLGATLVIGALIAAGYAVYSFRDQIADALAPILDPLKEVWDALRDIGDEMWQIVSGVGAQLWTEFKNNLGPAIADVAKIGFELLMPFLNMVIERIKLLAPYVRDVLILAMKGFATVLRAVAKGLRAVWEFVKYLNPELDQFIKKSGEAGLAPAKPAGAKPAAARPKEPAMMPANLFRRSPVAGPGRPVGMAAPGSPAILPPRRRLAGRPDVAPIESQRVSLAPRGRNLPGGGYVAGGRFYRGAFAKPRQVVPRRDVAREAFEFARGLRDPLALVPRTGAPPSLLRRPETASPAGVPGMSDFRPKRLHRPTNLVETTMEPAETRRRSALSPGQEAGDDHLIRQLVENTASFKNKYVVVTPAELRQ